MWRVAHKRKEAVVRVREEARIASFRSYAVPDGWVDCFSPQFRFTKGYEQKALLLAWWGQYDPS